MPLNFESGAFLLLIAAVVAMLTRRLHLPYSVGLVAAGVALALLPFTPKINLTKELIFTALLPPLIFEAAFSIRWKHLRRDFSVILILATLGVILSAAITSVGMHLVANWQWPTAAIFGILIAATDPVSVLATFREAKAQGRLLLLVEAESLLNDATAAIAFGLAITLTSGHSITALGTITTLLLTIGGGLLAGGIVAGGVLLLAGRTQDHLVELTFTTVAAYGSFLLAEYFHGSGVLATLVAGLLLGNYGALGRISERGMEAVRVFWEFAAFVANSLVFLLIGMHEALQNFAAVWLPVVAGILLVTLGRAAAIYPICLLFSRTALYVTMPHRHVLFWGGLRGALALALALGLPADMPGREQIITVSFAVVAFSIFVQGLTMTPLLRKMGEIPAEPAD
ncbi:MAG TPA: sodium:proton antiporter [Bryobacteraceae bacterium]|nr:sodium:proton antiporter [Bryobacteraceae bacterium]